MPINVKLFTHIASSKHMIADISDLPGKGFERLYPDSADEGLRIVNPRTGNVVSFFVSSVMRDEAEGELLGWELLPTPETICQHPEMAGYRVSVMND